MATSKRRASDGGSRDGSGLRGVSGGPQAPSAPVPVAWFWQQQVNESGKEELKKLWAAAETAATLFERWQRKAGHHENDRSDPLSGPPRRRVRGRPGRAHAGGSFAPRSPR